MLEFHRPNKIDVGKKRDDFDQIKIKICKIKLHPGIYYEELRTTWNSLCLFVKLIVNEKLNIRHAYYLFIFKLLK